MSLVFKGGGKAQEVKLHVNERKEHLPAHCKELVETLKQGSN